MNDDDLTRDLEAWAVATDPTDDPITTGDVDEARSSTPDVRRPASRPWLALAAALLVVLGVAGAVALVRDDGDGPSVVTDLGSVEPRTQIVVQTPDGAPHEERDVRQRWALHGPCDGRDADPCADELAPIDDGPLRHGTTLVVDRVLEPGTWALRLDTFLCGSAGCVTVGADGRPGQTTTGSSCTTAIEATGRATVVTRTLDADRCGPGDGSTVPGLTVPPAWSLRSDLPWDCGTVFSTVVPIGEEDGRDATALECFGRAAVDRTGPVEVPIVEEGGATPFREAWWRTSGDGAVEVLRAPADDGSAAWTRVTCTRGIEAHIAEGTFTYRPVDCADAEELPLDLPPLDEPLDTASATTTTVAADPDLAIDVVVDAQLGLWIEGVARRWAVLGPGGEEVAGGRLDQTGDLFGDDGSPPDVTLVAEGLPVPSAEGLTFRLEEYDCMGGCAPSYADPAPGARPTTCDAELATVAPGSVVVVTLRQDTCQAVVGTTRPPLTVPPAWSLRAPAHETCPREQWGEAADRALVACVVEAIDEDGTAEAEVDEIRDGAKVTVHVADGEITVFRDEQTETGTTWRVLRCDSLDVVEEWPYVEPTGCEPQETGTG